jgi:hypothetical protein
MEAATGHLPAAPSGKSLSTKSEVLQELAGLHPVVALIQEHRQLAKLLSGFVDTLVAHARASELGTQASSQLLLRRLRGGFLQVGLGTHHVNHYL